MSEGADSAAHAEAETVGRLREELAGCRAELLVVAKELRSAREQSASRDKIQDNFLRMISHELNTPISTLQICVKLMSRDPAMQSAPKLQRGLERIESSSKRLHQLVETMTEWTRVQGGRRPLRVEPVDLAALLDQALTDSGRLAQRKGLRFEAPAPAMLGEVRSDRSLLRLVLENLIARAVQLSNEGVVHVRVTPGAAAIRFEVRDTAPPVRASEALFDPLRSPTDLLRTCGSGSGLALSVLRDLALAIGSQLDVAPGNVRGNTTVLTVPFDLGVERVGDT